MDYYPSRVLKGPVQIYITGRFTLVCLEQETGQVDVDS